MPDNLPASLANLSYDQYRDIRFRPASALWHGQALFEVQFFHRGYRTRQRVNIFEVSGAGVNPVAYNPQYFSFGKLLKPPKAPANLGYAGFRVHYPLQTPAYKDELLVFLGASYFRVSGAISATAPRPVAWRSTPRCRAGRSFPPSPTSRSCSQQPASAA